MARLGTEVLLEIVVTLQPGNNGGAGTAGNGGSAGNPGTPGNSGSPGNNETAVREVPEETVVAAVMAVDRQWLSDHSPSRERR